ncbi:MAG: porin family protein [Micavibrio aeruginosavorus]|uniref:Porin family protein n=1 Tax=Micavibrio aeruginosavorus TaxID=349221 RepID=A0A7T5R2W7_9BACT|nr:MAG: porin family protein [Micavibrio aeruginosavorus]
MRILLLKYIAFAAFTAGLLTLPHNAQAQQSSRLYFSGYMGLNTFSSREFTHPSTNGAVEMKNGASFAGALGLRLSPNIRVEGEIAYSRSDLSNMTLDTGASGSVGKNVKTWLYMANVYYDFDVNWKNITPYVTGGLGLAMHDGGVAGAPGGLSDASDTSYNLAYAVGGGLKYQVKPGMALSGGYRYVGTTDFDIGDYSIDYGAHEFRMGLHYDLPVDLFK